MPYIRNINHISIGACNSMYTFHNFQNDATSLFIRIYIPLTLPQESTQFCAMTVTLTFCFLDLLIINLENNKNGQDFPLAAKSPSITRYENTSTIYFECWPRLKASAKSTKIGQDALINPMRVRQRWLSPSIYNRTYWNRIT